MYRSGSNASVFEYNNIIVELAKEKSSNDISSIQLHKLLDLNDDNKPNETKYEVRTMRKNTIQNGKVNLT